MKFKITSHDGRVLIISGDREPTEQDLQQLFSSLPPKEETPKQEITPLTDEQKQENKQRADEYMKNKGWDTSALGVAKDALIGAGKGIGTGLERLASGLTLGGYDWLSDKLGLGAKERKKELNEFGGTPMKFAQGGTEIVSSLIPSFGLWKGASAVSKAVPVGGKVGKAISLSKYPVSGAIQGGLSAGFEKDSLEDAKKGALTGSILSTAIPLTFYGVGKTVGAVTPKVLGLTTGSGEKSIEQAYSSGKRGSEMFLKNLRGQVDKQDIVGMAKDRLKQIKADDYQQYLKEMNKIGAKEGVKLKPIVDKYENILKAEGGGKPYLVDEDTSTFLKKAGKIVENFKNDKTARTLNDFDDLKQGIFNIKVDSNAGNAQRVQKELYNAIKGEIRKQAPVYDKIMNKSSKAIEEVKEIEKTLSLDKKANVDTSLRKLQSAFRNTVSSNYGNRGELVKKLGGDELADAISGQLLGDWLPRGLVARLGALGTGGLALKGVANPIGLTTMSPRLVGETAYKLGQIANKTSGLKSIAMPTLLEMIGEAQKKGAK